MYNTELILSLCANKLVITFGKRSFYLYFDSISRISSSLFWQGKIFLSVIFSCICFMPVGNLWFIFLIASFYRTNAQAWNFGSFCELLRPYSVIHRDIFRLHHRLLDQMELEQRSAKNGLGFSKSHFYIQVSRLEQRNQRAIQTAPLHKLHCESCNDLLWFWCRTLWNCSGVSDQTRW